MLIVLFLVSHFNFLFVPCGGLSWLPVSFLLHVKYTVSYRIVSINVVTLRWARLVLGWVTVFGRINYLGMYITSHLGQLSLAIPLWVSAMSTSLVCEGNRRSGIALAMRHRQ